MGVADCVVPLTVTKLPQVAQMPMLRAQLQRRCFEWTMRPLCHVVQCSPSRFANQPPPLPHPPFFLQEGLHTREYKDQEWWALSPPSQNTLEERTRGCSCQLFVVALARRTLSLFLASKEIPYKLRSLISPLRTWRYEDLDVHDAPPRDLGST
ncbi:hypothetical protein TWF106_000659 [Orbilia oligospora]|uniref:Uncharacterized protein n=1 Tax=Orbilia oligospora TaxID=2813651 RepID=A0A6G1M5D6_ORBOL|nr:hypothetical protein TWF679_009073 [Orbilia oligospora]KAF3206572.1 hypothetical protein TWF106_000659 [Orbilia oligospora]KAF3215985.1 hypothetical protein TWF191_009148 [Orbilia oligospora]KAF3243612.1 hypothetical protein TWF192_007998 [Orbilia oligospora]